MTDTERERISAICEVAGVTEIDDLSDGFALPPLQADRKGLLERKGEKG